MPVLAGRFAAATLIGSAVLASVGAAQDPEHGAMDHTTHMAGQSQGSMPTGAPVLTEPGQGAFAALSEIVRVLEADPATDWSAVNLTALRDHLIDMDRLVRDALVAETALPNGIRADVTGDPLTLAAVERMVPAHAAELAKDDRWKIDVQVGDDAVTLTVTSDDPATVARIRGLGFFGLMASQDHHREHHMAFALGGSHGH